MHQRGERERERERERETENKGLLITSLWHIIAVLEFWMQSEDQLDSQMVNVERVSLTRNRSLANIKQTKTSKTRMIFCSLALVVFVYCI